MTRPRAAALTLAIALVVGAAGCTGDSGGDDSSDEPDPQDAATALASGLTAKDLSKVALTSDTATTAQASYDRITQEMDAAKLQVDTAGVEQTGSTAVATLHWTWDLTSATWEYDAEAELKFAEDGWQVAWAPSVIEPSLVEGENLDVSAVLADRGDILGAGGQPLVTERQVSRVGIDKTQLGAARPGRIRTRRRPAGRRRRRAVREGGQGGRRAGLRRGDRLPAGGAARGGEQRHHGHPGWPDRGGQPAARADPRLRGAAARQGRRGDGRDHRGAPGVPAR